MDRLSYEELIKTCSLLGVYVERLASRVAVLEEQADFWATQILKFKVDVYNTDKYWSRKTPWKRIDELEESLKGMNTYYQEKLAELQVSKRKKRDII